MPEQWTDTEIRIAIEFKWCNMSVVLADAQLPWIIGFKPLLNYQQRLRELIGTWLLEHAVLRTALDLENPAVSTRLHSTHDG